MTRVLIVDDHAPNLYLLRTLLEGQGYEVVEARDGAEAIEVARQCRPDLIVSDLLMPGVDGYRLLRTWRADDVVGEVPFVVYTATYTTPRDERLSSGFPTSASSLASCWLSAGWAMKSWRDAFERLPLSTIWVK